MSSLGHIWGDRDAQHNADLSAFARGRIGIKKPHIFFDGGRWVARFMNDAGIGFTPSDAYTNLMLRLQSYQNRFTSRW